MSLLKELRELKKENKKGVPERVHEIILSFLRFHAKYGFESLRVYTLVAHVQQTLKTEFPEYEYQVDEKTVLAGLVQNGLRVRFCPRIGQMLISWS